MKKSVFATIATILISILAGCQGGDTNVVKIKPTGSTTVEPESGNSVNGDGMKVVIQSGGTQDSDQQAAKLIEQAAESDSKGADNARKWIADRLNDATNSSSAIAGDASEWASEMFHSLKDQGLTSADSARQWLTDDIRNMNALNYKIIKVSLDDLAAVEEQLNELGAARWECFHAVNTDQETVLFFKKNRRSILKNIPATDLMKLIPLMGNGEKE